MESVKSDGLFHTWYKLNAVAVKVHSPQVPNNMYIVETANYDPSVISDACTSSSSSSKFKV
jgi:hypothetical protein